MEASNASSRNRDPSWWDDSHSSAWERAKAAMRRDWEQTKADFSGGKQGRDLDQHVGDTVGQALGKKPIPPLSVPNPPDPGDAQPARGPENRDSSWDEVEGPSRYGFGAARFYNRDWDEDLETTVRGDWQSNYPDRPWNEAREHVRRGWDRGRSAE